MAILVSNRMDRDMPHSGRPRLARSCGPGAGDWIRFAPVQPGIERIEARFAGHAYDPHRHDTYAVGFTLAGVQSFDYRGARRDSRAGNVIVLHPDERHDGRAGADLGFRYRMAYFAPRLIRDALGARAASLPFVGSAVSSDPRLLAALRLALDDLDRPLEPLELDRAVLATAEALRLADRSAGRTPAAPANANAVETARAFLDANAARVVASEELEALTGLDRFTLARLFRRQLGTSPYRYLTMRRLDRVRALLSTGQSLADAALAAGFADQAHMTRRFKMAYGLTPGRWRAMRRA
jgi:AraC-like DNA-binding protein